MFFGFPERFRLALGARLLAPRLDAEIAAGVRHEADRLRAERARLLCSVGTRSRVADQIDRVLESAARGYVGDLGVPVPDPTAVAEARPLLLSIAACLRDMDTEPGVRGIAMTTCLLGDAEGPLYQPGDGADLCARTQSIFVALRSRTDCAAS